MTFIEFLVQKFGSFKSRKNGEELLFFCPSCDRQKFYVNIKKGVFNCVRCGHHGKLVKDENTGILRASLLPPPTELVERNTDLEIPEYVPFSSGNPGTSSMVHFLMSRGIPSMPSQWGSSTYWKLRDRLIIPIREEGKIVSYVARAVDGSEPKELSGPNRGSYLYGYDGVRSGRVIVIVEGIFDCEKVKRAGYDSLAILGSHITDTQVGKLGSLKPNKIKIMFDGDDAGWHGMMDAYDKIIKRLPWIVEWVYCPEGEDPGDLSEKEIRNLLG